MILNHMVEFFEDMSGLEINRSKCQNLGINCDQRKVGRRADLFGCEIGFSPSFYLDFPLGGNSKVTSSLGGNSKIQERLFPIGRKVSFPRQAS